MGENPTVGRGGGMVRFVNDDGAKIGHEVGKPGPATQRLHAGHDDWGGAGHPGWPAPRPGGATDQRGQWLEGLLDQLVAVRQDQGPAPAPLHEQGEDDRFARAGG